MAYVHHIGWRVVDAQATLTLGQRAFEHHQDVARQKMGFVSRKGAWKPVGHYVSLGSEFPGRLLEVLSANSVGGVGGNQWSSIALVELEVQGTVLDKIVEAVSE